VEAGKNRPFLIGWIKKSGRQEIKEGKKKTFSGSDPYLWAIQESRPNSLSRKTRAFRKFLSTKNEPKKKERRRKGLG